jgi:hypothetical protein
MNKLALASFVLVLAPLATAWADVPPPSRPYLPPPATPDEQPPLPPMQTVSGHMPKSFLSGWHLDLSSAYTRIGDRDGSAVGLRGVIMLNDRLGVGLAGYLLGTEDMKLEDNAVRQAGLYGGLYGQYVLASSQLVHGFVDTTVGTGGWCERSIGEDCDEYEFVFVEPTANLELNLTANVRVAVGVGYRQAWETSGPEPEDGVSGVVVRSSLVIGAF